MADAALKDMSARFDASYGENGRKSIPPELLLRALHLQMLYSIRSERMLMEQLEYNFFGGEGEVVLNQQGLTDDGKILEVYLCPSVSRYSLQLGDGSSVAGLERQID